MHELFQVPGDPHDKGMSHTEHSVLCTLLRIVDSRDPVILCTQGELAEWVKVHRTNLNKVLDGLVARKVVEYDFPKGHRGWVRVTGYDDLVGS